MASLNSCLKKKNVIIQYYITIGQAQSRTFQGCVMPSDQELEPGFYVSFNKALFYIKALSYSALQSV